jgi:hypothetical protein
MTFVISINNRKLFKDKKMIANPKGWLHNNID